MTSHNDLRVSTAMVAEYRTFIEQAEAARAIPAEVGPRPASVKGRRVAAALPSTGVTAPLGAALGALGLAGAGCAWLATTRRRRP